MCRCGLLPVRQAGFPESARQVANQAGPDRHAGAQPLCLPVVLLFRCSRGRGTLAPQEPPVPLFSPVVLSVAQRVARGLLRVSAVVARMGGFPAYARARRPVPVFRGALPVLLSRAFPPPWARCPVAWLRPPEPLPPAWLRPVSEVLVWAVVLRASPPLWPEAGQAAPGRRARARALAPARRWHERCR